MAVQNAYDWNLKSEPARSVNARVLSVAINEASADTQRNSEYRLGAVLFHRKRIISAGHNRRKTHPKSRHKYKWLHAEMDAILRAQEDLRGASILTVRLRKDDTIGRSMPCRECMDWLRELGIKRVIFAEKDGSFSSITIRS